jgi:predicted ArsR family transcriptional regulator
MPKPYGYSAKGQIEGFLKEIYPNGSTIEDMAIRFEIQPKTVKSHLNEFQMNNMVKNKDNIFYWKQS